MTLGLALLAASALAATFSASAFGHEFVVSKLGKLAGVQLGEQDFTVSGIGHVDCTEASGQGEATALKFLTFKEIITYSHCNDGNVTISPVHFEFNGNGNALIEKTATVEEVGAGCEVLLRKQTLEGFEFENSSGKVTMAANFHGLHSAGTGGICGGEDTEGTYAGTLSISLVGGTIEWK
jgi:hypothetical protein